MEETLQDNESELLDDVGLWALPVMCELMLIHLSKPLLNQNRLKLTAERSGHVQEGETPVLYALLFELDGMAVQECGAGRNKAIASDPSPTRCGVRNIQHGPLHASSRFSCCPRSGRSIV